MARKLAHDKKRKQIVVKCDMCGDYRHMACVYNCPTGAMQVLTPEELIKMYEEE
jgi:Fe-S-cluster-containing hydrogenase component 2